MCVYFSLKNRGIRRAPETTNRRSAVDAQQAEDNLDNPN